MGQPDVLATAAAFSWKERRPVHLHQPRNFSGSTTPWLQQDGDARRRNLRDKGELHSSLGWPQGLRHRDAHARDACQVQAGS